MLFLISLNYSEEKQNAKNMEKKRIKCTAFILIRRRKAKQKSYGSGSDHQSLKNPFLDPTCHNTGPYMNIKTGSASERFTVTVI